MPPMSLEQKEWILKEVFGENYDKVELVEANLLETEKLYEAV